MINLTLYVTFIYQSKVFGFIILVMIIGCKKMSSIYSYAALVLDCCARSSSYATLLFETTSSPPPWIQHGENAVCLTCHCIASCSDDIADNIAGFLSLQSLLSLNPKISTHATLKSTADTKKSRKYWKRNHDKSCSVSIHRAPCTSAAQYQLFGFGSISALSNSIFRYNWFSANNYRKTDQIISKT